MVSASPWTTVRGPTFIRLLARLTDVDVAQSKQSLSDRLSHWLDWTHALALSTVLDGQHSADGGGAPSFGSADDEECARVRASLAQTIAGDKAFTERQPADEGRITPSSASATSPCSERCRPPPAICVADCATCSRRRATTWPDSPRWMR